MAEISVWCSTREIWHHSRTKNSLIWRFSADSSWHCLRHQSGLSHMCEIGLKCDDWNDYGVCLWKTSSVWARRTLATVLTVHLLKMGLSHFFLYSVDVLKIHRVVLFGAQSLHQMLRPFEVFFQTVVCIINLYSLERVKVEQRWCCLFTFFNMLLTWSSEDLWTNLLRLMFFRTPMQTSEFSSVILT